jgi:predicted nuclease with TOPRIM domain
MKGTYIMEELQELVEKLAEENIQLRYELAFIDGKIDNLVGRIIELEAKLSGDPCFKDSSKQGCRISSKVLER